jgi:hypothetical protein
MAKRKNSERNADGVHWWRVRAMQKRWDNPAQRERMLEQIKRMNEQRKAMGAKGTRQGIPDGMRRRDAEPMQAKARAEAERIVKKMADKGMFDDVDPLDRERAEAAMVETIAIMKADGDKRLRLAAAKVVLDFTKSKPVAKIAHQVNAAEAWLQSIADDDGDVQDTDAPAEDAGDKEETA